MKLRTFAVGFMLTALAASLQAQRIAIGIAPTYDAGGDEFGDAVIQHLSLFIYQGLVDSKQFAPRLLTPGGVYTPLDTSWLTDYVQDRPELDLLLISTLKPTVTDKNGSTISVELSLLDAHTGDNKGSWTVTDMTKTKSAWLQKGESMVTSAVTGRGSQYGYSYTPSTDFQKQPIGKTTAHLAQEARDTLPAHLAGFTKAGASADAPAAVGGPCAMHTKLTYNYKHSASHSYNLMVNELDETTTIQDGIGTFQAPAGPIVLQFTINDAPYKLARENLYQLSAVHSCAAGAPSTLVIDVGQGGDAHDRWE